MDYSDILSKHIDKISEYDKIVSSETGIYIVGLTLHSPSPGT
jgi:hypothetical protein